MENCKDCGEPSVKEEFENGVRVCTDCGAIDKDAHDFVTAASFEGTSYSDGKGRGPDGFKQSSHVGPRRVKALEFGLSKTRLFGRKLCMNDSIIKEATNIYNIVFQKQPRSVTYDKRTAMIGACLFCAARQNGIAITLRSISSVLDIERAGHKVCKALNILKKSCGIQPSPLSTTNETDHFFSQHEFSAEVKTLTHDIMSLCKRYWLSQGRIKTITCIVAVFFAWRACNYTPGKKNKLGFRRFCQKFSLECTRACTDRKSEVKNVLEAAVYNIPWLQGQKIEDIDGHIKDAVKFQACLKLDTLQTAENNKKQKNIKEETESVEKQNTVVKTEAVEKSLTDTEMVFRTRPYYKKRIHHTEEISHESRKPDKLEKFNRDLESEDDLDLGSDDDTDMYIRSEKDVEKIKEVYEKMKEVA